MIFDTLDALRAVCLDPPDGDADAQAAVAERQRTLTKPEGSLGRLETLAGWLARWQGREMPVMDKVKVLVFAGNHGVAAQGVSAYPAEVTGQMLQSFRDDKAAINQLCRSARVGLLVTQMSLHRPTADFTQAPAMDQWEFLEAVQAGWNTVEPGTSLLCLGEMGIGNTTAAAAIAAALFGGGGAEWCGRGTGVDDAGLARKRAAVDAGLARHAVARHDPLRAAACLGGREMAAILGATLAARHHGIPVLLDGFVCVAAVAPLAVLHPGGLDHTVAAHVSAEAAGPALLARLGLVPLLDLGLRLGEASGAVLAVPLLRAAVACHTGMATFAEAGVSGPA